MNIRTAFGIAAGALIGLAAWPAFVATRESALIAAPARAIPSAAPVKRDYLQRNEIVSDFERDVRRHPDQLVTRMLAGQYLQRYRETADAGDLLRAVAVTKQSLALQPRFNVAAEASMAAADAALHKFREAKAYADDVVRLTPWSCDALATDANLAMEIGEYDAARHLLESAPKQHDCQAWDVTTARYDELTGRLSTARSLIRRAMLSADGMYDTPAEGRAWYHWRSGELAFEAGDRRAAEAEYKEALVLFPTYWHADAGLAKVYWSERRWPETIAAANASMAVYPLPETFGYKYDALVAMGDRAGAAQTLDLIVAIERIGDAQHLSDRLIAAFYADHGVRVDDAVAISRRDLERRDDVYAEDTLAWALAAAGRWQDARPHAERAVRLGSQDSRLLYHAGIIAVHCANRSEAEARLQSALALNPHFHPVQADAARQALAQLQKDAQASRTRDNLSIVPSKWAGHTPLERERIRAAVPGDNGALPRPRRT